MVLNVSKGLAYLLLIAVIVFLTLLLVVNIQSGDRTLDIFGRKVVKKEVSSVKSASKDGAGVGSTRKIESRDTFLESDQIERITDYEGSGVFHTLWYSTTSELVWLRVIIDGEVVWKNQTGIFGHSWAFNKRESGVGGVTNYGESSTHLGPVYGVYFKPSPVGLPFKESLKIEFGSDAPDEQLVYYATGFYSANE
ncbi:MAG: hypothetical protein ACE5E0_01175 [Terriglobia bacterium]